MANLYLVFDAIVRWLGEALSVFTDHWLTTVFLFLIVLNFIVSLLIIFRGDRN